MTIQALFGQVLNLSFAGSIAIIAVLLIRVLLHKAPRIFSYMLWGVVLVRLLCPVTIASPLGVVPDLSQVMDTVMGPTHDGGFAAWTGMGQLPSVIAFLWVEGMVLLLLWSMTQQVQLHQTLCGSIHLEQNLWQSEYVDSPFVLGVFHPQIYLPASLYPSEYAYVLSHERHHVRRGDPLLRLLGYIALCIHWFNPLVWAAWYLSEQDMEISCDEAVMNQSGSDVRTDYAQSLLRFSVDKRASSLMPVAFGEKNVKKRILNIVHWKKPATVLMVLCMLFFLVCCCCLLTKPQSLGLILQIIGE